MWFSNLRDQKDVMFQKQNTVNQLENWPKSKRINQKNLRGMSRSIDIQGSYDTGCVVPSKTQQDKLQYQTKWEEI